MLSGQMEATGRKEWHESGNESSQCRTGAFLHPQRLARLIVRGGKSGVDIYYTCRHTTADAHARTQAYTHIHTHTHTLFIIDHYGESVGLTHAHILTKRSWGDDETPSTVSHSLIPSHRHIMFKQRNSKW